VEFQFTVDATIAEDPARASEAFDRMRESCLPNDFGITIWNLRGKEDGGRADYLADVEIEAGSEDEARDVFDRFREARCPGTEHGVTLSNLTATAEASPSAAP
jgi:hypothetical protein